MRHSSLGGAIRGRSNASKDSRHLGESLVQSRQDERVPLYFSKPATCTATPHRVLSSTHLHAKSQLRCTLLPSAAVRYDCFQMLKIGTVRWRGKCLRHPRFDPEVAGIGAVIAGCSRCQDLQAIFESHQRTLRLLRTFAPTRSPRRRKRVDPGRQQDLFAPLA
jgi:hypothetical protein